MTDGTDGFVPSGRVLVVEDDPSVRRLLDILLQSEGYEVVVASDGLAALAQAAAVHPHLVILDLVMPDLGGLRVLDEMAADPALANVPVLVVTGQADALASVRDRLGDDHVCLKPFGVDDLLARVAALTGRMPG